MNEEEVKLKIVLPLLLQLGFDLLDLRFEEYNRSELTTDRRFFSDIVAFKDDKPIVLVETKASGIALTGQRGEAAVDQALAYARGRREMPPLALITNGSRVLLVDVIGGAVALASDYDPELPANSVETMRSVVQESLGRLQERRRQAIASLGFPSRTDLLQACRRQCEREISALSGMDAPRASIVERKFVPALYVSRSATQAAVDQCLQEEWPVCAVVGDAGMGKTSFLCAFARGRSGPTLLYNAADLSESLFQSIVTDLSIPYPGVSALAEGITKALEPDERFLICVDAINEVVAHRDDLWAELNLFSQRFAGSRCRLLLTCRTADWPSWSRTRSGALSPLGRAIKANASGRRAGDRGMLLDRLSVSEFEEAWLRYSDTYHLRGQLSHRMTDMCREPFMLRLLAEVYRNAPRIPEYVEPVELFRRYFIERFPLENRRRMVSSALSMLASAILKAGNPRVPSSVIPPEHGPAIEALLDENVVIYRKDGYVGFRFELFLEYVLSEFVKTAAGNASADKVVAVEDIGKSGFLNGPGVVENLLLEWQSDPKVLLEIGSRLKGWNDNWKAILASALRKTVTPVKEWWELITALAEDRNPVIRQCLAQSLTTYVAIHGWGVIDDLSRSRAWKAREVAASSIGFLEETAEHKVPRLLILSGDFHWRVRRAAGYSLKPFVNTPAVRRQLDAAIESDWKSQYAMIIALAGADLDDDDFTHRLITQLADSDHPQVRWTVAHYLPRFRGSRAMLLLQRLANDGDAWIRKKVASSAVTILTRSPHDAAEVLNRLVDDRDCGVRVQLARDLAMAETNVAMPYLERLLEGSDDAAFAAAFTIRELSSIDHRRAHEILETTLSARDLALRERIARRDVELLHSPMAALSNYIARRTEYLDRADPYMDVVDTMHGLIRDSAETIDRAGGDSQRLIATLARDTDEAVRWALVLFLAEQTSIAQQGGMLQRTLRALSIDPHWWVRREVALALRQFIRVEADGWERDLLVELVTRERALAQHGSDEVMFFAEAS